MADTAHRLHIAPAGWELAAPGHLPLLDAAQAGGVRLPRSCRNGTCRACLCRLVAGTVRYQVEWPGLSQEEREAGWTLPCVALPCTDVVLEVPAAQGQPP